MKVIKNKMPGDCGVCAVATLLQISYGEAIKLVYPNGWDALLVAEGTSTLVVAAALNQHVKDAVEIPRMRELPIHGDRWQHLPHRILLLYVTFGHKQNSHHWVVYDGKHVYDSNFDQKLTVKEYRDKCLNSYGFHVRVEAYLPVHL